jgi:hypothetical protein
VKDIPRPLIAFLVAITINPIGLVLISRSMPAALSVEALVVALLGYVGFSIWKDGRREKV